MSAYICFSMDARKKLKSEHPDCQTQEVMKAIGAMWDKISDAEKKKYTDMSLKLKEEYAREKEAYDAKIAAEARKEAAEQEEEDDEDEDDDDGGPKKKSKSNKKKRENKN